MSSLLWRLFRNNETALHELSYLFWECTTRCNLHCRHCGSDCGVQQREADMPLEDFLSALDTLPTPEAGEGFVVVLTGGEPLLRPDLAECGRAIRERGWSWSMVSNGYFYDEAKQAELLAAGLGALTISLDGLEESHNWMRGNPHGFERALRAIRTAATAPRLAWDVVTCVNGRNYGELQQIHDLLESIGVPQWRLFTIIPIGRAASDPEMKLSQEQVRGLMEFIKTCRKKPSSMKTTFSCEGWLGPYEKVVRDTPAFCRAGINIASVLIDGRICACPNVDRDVFSQGNIYKDNLYEVWQKGFKPFRDRTWTRTGPCAQCKAWKDCLGGGMHNWHGGLSEPLECYHL